MNVANRVLKGHRILITREYTAEYESLEEQGADLFVFPTVEAVPPENYRDLDRAIRNLHEYNWLVFTSRNGVHFFFRRLLESGTSIEPLTGVCICAVGPGTARALDYYGLKADLIPKRFSAEGLIEAFTQPGAAANSLKGISFLFPRAEAARDLFPSKIRELGGAIEAPVAYRTVIPHLKRDIRVSVLDAGITIATFTSGSTFTNFLDMVGPRSLSFLSQVAIAVIGPVTQQTIEKAGLPVSIMPAKATIEAMVDAIIEWAT
jgi:uroporphyrinogen III methyltransferase / synthase